MRIGDEKMAKTEAEVDEELRKLPKRVQKAAISMVNLKEWVRHKSDGEHVHLITITNGDDYWRGIYHPESDDAFILYSMNEDE